MGAIGKAIAVRLQGWGANLLYSEPEGLPSDEERNLGLAHTGLEELLAQSDIVILALALNEHTFHTINPIRLALMKRGAYLINPCRGSVVDENAVLAALASGQLGGYAADVFEMEDWARTDRPHEISPSLHFRLLRLSIDNDLPRQRRRRQHRRRPAAKVPSAEGVGRLTISAFQR